MTISIKEAYRKERARLLGFIRNRVASDEDAEDILQDVFMSTLEGVSITEPIENILGWLYTSARNKVIDWYRKKRAVTISLSDQDNISLDQIVTEIRLNPEHAFYRNLIIEELTESLDELPPKQKSVFIWTIIEGKTFREISEETGESISTLLSRKRYAIQFLRHRLKEINEIINTLN